jgi:1,4-alpha-glucan branching enzyme
MAGWAGCNPVGKFLHRTSRSSNLLAPSGSVDPWRSGDVMSLSKRYLKSKGTCKVTFKLPGKAAPSAVKVCLVGDFNAWDAHATPMKKLRTGDYSATLDLEAGHRYQFKYLIDEKAWENDWNADEYVPSPVGDGDNSVVVV